MCWERPSNGDRAAGSACDVATGYGTRQPIAFDDPRSPFDGSHRETYFNQTTISNRGRPPLESQAFGAERPYGGRAVHAPN